MESIRVSALPKGTAFIRFAKAKAMAGKAGAHSAASFSDAWRGTPEVGASLRAGIDATTLELVAKGAIDVGSVADASWAGALVQYQHMASEFAELLRPQ